MVWFSASGANCKSEARNGSLCRWRLGAAHGLDVSIDLLLICCVEGATVHDLLEISECSSDSHAIHALALQSRLTSCFEGCLISMQLASLGVAQASARDSRVHIITKLNEWTFWLRCLGVNVGSTGG